MSDKPHKSNGWYDAYKSVRKQMPPPGKIEGDSREEYEEEEGEVSLEDLKNDAEVICDGRGHILGEWLDKSRGSSYISDNRCINCSRDIRVIERPLANERDIMGAAGSAVCDSI